jgi:hypothetical protein
VLCKSIRIHFHRFTPSRPPLPEKKPQGHGGQGEKPFEENSFPSNKRTIRE